MSVNNSSAGDIAEIIAGSARLLLADIGTPIPTFDSDTITWDPAWDECGYTDKGLDLTYTPTMKGIMADEVLGEVKTLLTGEKMSISTVFKQATLTNIANAIAASKVTNVAAAHLQVGTKKVSIGSGVLVEKMVAFEGLGPDGVWRVFVGYRGMASAAVKLAMSLTTETMVPFNMDFKVDATKALGDNLGFIIEMTAPALP